MPAAVDGKGARFVETAVFAGCARDTARYLPEVLQNIDRMAGLFSDAAYVIVENDSRDATKSILSTWGKGRNNAAIVTMDGLGQVGARTLRLEIARNTYVELVRADENLSKFDFMVVLDFDNVNSAPLDLTAVSGAVDFLKSGSDHAGVFCNSKGTYYDLWALRHRTLRPGDIWESVCDYALAHNVSDEVAFSQTFARHLVSFPMSQPPVEVDSAFGGLGIYKLDYVLRNPNPYLGYKVKAYPGPNAGRKIGRWQTCEHVHFNRGIRSLGGRLFVVPPLVNVDATRTSFPPSAWRSMIF